MPIQVPILMYHALDDRPSPISVHPKVFEWQMGWLHQSGLQVIPLAQVVECLINHQPLPKRSVVLTFDDGLESVYSLGFPVLARYEFPATVFWYPTIVVGQTTGLPNHLPLLDHP